VENDGITKQKVIFFTISHHPTHLIQHPNDEIPKYEYCRDCWICVPLHVGLYERETGKERE
jgi:hypothetical protein